MKGVLQVDFYTEEREKVNDCILKSGDTIILVSGGHGFKVLEKLKVMEVKQGPYLGIEDDKIILE